MLIIFKTLKLKFQLCCPISPFCFYQNVVCNFITMVFFFLVCNFGKLNSIKNRIKSSKKYLKIDLIDGNKKKASQIGFYEN